MSLLPPILKSSTLLAEINCAGRVMSRSTLHDYATKDETWSACVISRNGRNTLWSLARLIESGILPGPERRAPEPSPAPTKPRPIDPLKALAQLAGVCLLLLSLAGCGARPVAALRPTLTPDGADVACTWKAFAERWPDQHRKGAIGCYDHATRSCWYVCADPACPTVDEGYELAHERCHRLESEYGTDVADLEWAKLPRRYLTHRAVIDRLLAKGLLL